MCVMVRRFALACGLGLSVVAATSGCGESTQQEIDDISATTGPDDQSVVDEPSTVISPEHQYQGEDEF